MVGTAALGRSRELQTRPIRNRPRMSRWGRGRTLTRRYVFDIRRTSSTSSLTTCDLVAQESLHPPVDGDVVDLDATLDQQFLHVAVREAVAQVPPDRDDDHLGREPEAGERRLWRQPRARAGRRLHRSTLPGPCQRITQR